MWRLWLAAIASILTLALVSPVYAIQEPEPPTPTPTVETAPAVTPEPEITDQPVVTEAPAETPAETPTVEPTPLTVILITPTPQRTPPSLQIPGLLAKFGLRRPHVFGALAPAPAWSVSAVPPEVDQVIDLFWDWLLDRQREYHDLTGRFCQMLPSHVSAIPANGVHLYPDGWYHHPTDQQYSWDSLNAIQYEPLPFSIRIDVYDGPAGGGYIACFRMGDLERCRNHGAEALRSTGWAPVVEDQWP